MKIGSSHIRGTPIGGGGSVKMTLNRSEGAVLNVESKRAIYSYLPEFAKDQLGEYMKNNYESWMKEKRFRGLKSHDLILVTGTTMTANWEAATFRTSSTSVNVKLSVKVPAVTNDAFKIV